MERAKGQDPLLDPLFFFPKIEEDILGEADGVLLGEVDPPVPDDRLELFDRGFGHSDHRLGLAQNPFELGIRKLRGPLEPQSVLLEVPDKVPDAHGGGL